MRAEFRKAISVLLILFCGMFLGMDIKTDAAEISGDSLKIISVTPDAVMDYTRPITFTVVVEYSLSSKEEATLHLAFNTTKSNVFTYYEELPISKGIGQATLSTTITPVGWGTSNAPKGAIGNLIDSFMGRRFQVKVTMSAGQQQGSDETALGEDTYDIGQGVPTGTRELDSVLISATSTEYSPELSFGLIQLASAAYQDEEGIRNTYVEMGFPQENIQGIYEQKPRLDWDSAKFTVGSKFLPTGEQLVLIAVRGTEGEIYTASPDWISNFHMGDAYSGAEWHEGFKSGAYVVYNFLKNDYFDGNLPTSQVKYVLTGHSRGGAIANLVSVLLMNDGVPQQNLFDYNFACPDVARDMGGNWNPDGKYDNIFNIGNSSDPVPQLPGLTGDTLPFVLDFFSHKDKWYSKVINAVNQTSVEQLYTSWGKYGRSYWFSENWGDADSLLPDFLSHDQKCYQKYLSKRLPISEMKSWAETKALVLSRGPSLRTVAGIFLCPVDVVFKDMDGNILASVKDGELEYTAAEDCCAVILTDGDKKIIRLQSAKEIEVEIVGTDRGTMSMVLLEGDSLFSEYSDAVSYENIKLKKGKAITTSITPEESLETIQVFALSKTGEIHTEIREDGKETLVDGSSELLFFITENPWIIIIAGVLVIGAAAFFVIAIRFSKKKANIVGTMEVLAELPGEDDDIICSCGAANPPWVKKCIACGQKLKKRRKK